MTILFSSILTNTKQNILSTSYVKLCYLTFSIHDVLHKMLNLNKKFTTVDGIKVNVRLVYVKFLIHQLSFQLKTMVKCTFYFITKVYSCDLDYLMQIRWNAETNLFDINCQNNKYSSFRNIDCMSTKRFRT